MSPRKKRVFFSLGMFALMILLLSITYGRDFYTQQKVTLLSFALTHTLGYLFFLVMPTELFFLQYVTQTGTYVLPLIIAVTGATLAHCVDYVVGHFVGEAVLSDIIGPKRHERARRTLEHYGNMTLFLFSLLPLSSPIIVLVAGMLRFRFRHVLFYTCAGLLVKYTAIILVNL